MLGLFGILKTVAGEDICDNDVVYKKLVNSTQRCAYVMAHDGCEGESLINYYRLFYCKMDESYIAGALFSVRPPSPLARSSS
ncbi:MAG: hypothetical protein P4M11_13310 [Candidatus Pacebacteria bacterium]|nr:hypothetical protein [Candidatus Paceibacterota bacterium]